MKANVGGIDKVLRGVLGVVLLAAGFLAGIAAPWNYVAMGVGVVMLATSLLSFCPLYSILGLNTCKVCNNNES
jgi:hypothetical protein